jgi:hypothetical protein
MAEEVRPDTSAPLLVSVQSAGGGLAVPSVVLFEGITESERVFSEGSALT